MHLIEKLEKKLSDVLKELGYEITAKLEVSNRPDLSEYQFNGAFALAKEYRKNPNLIAEEIIDALKKESTFKEITNVGGFINFTLTDEALTSYVNDVLKNNDINKHLVKDQRVLLDYGGANIAKELHVGHLRPANIGEALKRLFAYCGYETISDVHLGDWGLPMGLIIREIKERYPNLPYFDEKFDGEYPAQSPVDVKELNEIYPAASKKSKEDENYLNDAREITSALQKKHPGYYALFKAFSAISVADVKELYDKLGAKFDLWEGEYSAEEYINPTLELFQNSGYLRDSKGAKVIDVAEDTDKKEMPPAIVVTSAGSATYATTDLATLYTRMQRFELDDIIYITDNRQELHFTQVFRTAYKTGLVPGHIKMEHIGHGAMTAPDGKPFKTRDGGLLSLRGLIADVTNETRKYIKDNIKEEDKDTLAEELAIAAIKYADLLPNPTSDYVFDPIKFSDLNGKTGPYLIYSTVRMNSLMKKCAEESIVPGVYKILGSKEEREIILNLLKIKSVLEKSLNARALNEVADFVYKLTSSFNAFYGEHEILKQNNPELQESWITLTKLIYDTNTELLNILGLKVPDKI